MSSANYQTDLPCTLCKTVRLQRCFHHIYTRKSHPEYSNEPWNMMPLCFKCHELIHRFPLKDFSDKHQAIREFLITNGWELDFRGRWVHAKSL